MKIIFEEVGCLTKKNINELLKILKDDGFYDFVANHSSYANTELSAKLISSLIKKYIEKDIEIFLVFKKNFLPFSRKITYLKKGHLNSIFLNTRKLDKNFPKIAESIVHNLIHLIDNHYTDFPSFGHDRYKHPESAVIWISDFVKRILISNGIK